MIQRKKYQIFAYKMRAFIYLNWYLSTRNLAFMFTTLTVSILIMSAPAIAFAILRELMNQLLQESDKLTNHIGDLLNGTVNIGHLRRAHEQLTALLLNYRWLIKLIDDFIAYYSVIGETRPEFITRFNSFQGVGDALLALFRTLEGQLSISLEQSPIQFTSFTN